MFNAFQQARNCQVLKHLQKLCRIAIAHVPPVSLLSSTITSHTKWGRARESHWEVKPFSLFCRVRLFTQYSLVVSAVCVTRPRAPSARPGRWCGAERGLSSVSRVHRYSQRHHHQLQGPAEIPGERCVCVTLTPLFTLSHCSFALPLTLALTRFSTRSLTHVRTLPLVALLHSHSLPPTHIPTYTCSPTHVLSSIRVPQLMFLYLRSSTCTLTLILEHSHTSIPSFTLTLPLVFLLTPY